MQIHFRQPALMAHFWVIISSSDFHMQQHTPGHGGLITAQSSRTCMKVWLGLLPGLLLHTCEGKCHAVLQHQVSTAYTHDSYFTPVNCGCSHQSTNHTFCSALRLVTHVDAVKSQPPLGRHSLLQLWDLQSKSNNCKRL